MRQSMAKEIGTEYTVCIYVKICVHFCVFVCLGFLRSMTREALGIVFAPNLFSNITMAIGQVGLVFRGLYFSVECPFLSARICLCQPDVDGWRRVHSRTLYCDADSTNVCEQFRYVCLLVLRLLQNCVKGIATMHWCSAPAPATLPPTRMLVPP